MQNPVEATFFVIFVAYITVVTISRKKADMKSVFKGLIILCLAFPLRILFAVATKQMSKKQYLKKTWHAWVGNISAILAAVYIRTTYGQITFITVLACYLLAGTSAQIMCTLEAAIKSTIRRGLRYRNS